MSVLSRVFEEAGLTTVALALVKEHAQKVRPPRALFVPFPFGFAMGRPDNTQFQHRVIAAAMDLLKRPGPPVLEEFPEEAGPAALPQASQVGSASSELRLDPADEVTALRPFYERWVEGHGGRTAVGICGVPQRRFRGAIRFLEAYARGEECHYPEKPADLPEPRFIRYFVDDLKAFFYEAHMAQRPHAAEPELHRWFWGETSAGKLVAEVAARMNSSDDPALQTVAYGIAR